MLLELSLIAAVSATIGAVFAVWRWSYALKAYKLQKLQVTIQILMLDESREYWKTPKMKYVKEKEGFFPQLKDIIEEAKKAGLKIV